MDTQQPHEPAQMVGQPAEPQAAEPAAEPVTLDIHNSAIGQGASNG